MKPGREAMSKVIAGPRLEDFYLYNASMLGMEVTATAGYGICCVNGTDKTRPDRKHLD